MIKVIFAISIGCLLSSVAAVEFSFQPRQLTELSGTCPKDSVGNFPNCKCNNGRIYNADNSICLDLDKTICPKRSVGTAPHCTCEEGYKLDDIHWYCRPWYLNVTHIEDEPCEPHHIWNGTHCAKIPCPRYSKDAPELFFPNCTYYAPVVVVNSTHEPEHTTNYRCTNCISNCPAYHYWNRKTEKCERIKCPDGYFGDYQPNCIFKPKCPAEFPGEWPYCNIYDAGPRLSERKNLTELKHLNHNHHHHN